MVECVIVCRLCVCVFGVCMNARRCFLLSFVLSSPGVLFCCFHISTNRSYVDLIAIWLHIYFTLKMH